MDLTGDLWPGTFFPDVNFLEKAHSRRDQRYISTGSTSQTSGVSQCCLNESTTFAIKPTTPWRIIRLGCFKVTQLNPNSSLKSSLNSGDLEPQLQISNFQIRKFVKLRSKLRLEVGAFGIDLMRPIPACRNFIPQLGATTLTYYK